MKKQFLSNVKEPVCKFDAAPLCSCGSSAIHLSVMNKQFSLEQGLVTGGENVKVFHTYQLHSQGYLTYLVAVTEMPRH